MKAVVCKLSEIQCSVYATAVNVQLISFCQTINETDIKHIAVWDIDSNHID